MLFTQEEIEKIKEIIRDEILQNLSVYVSSSSDTVGVSLRYAGRSFSVNSSNIYVSN